LRSTLVRKTLRNTLVRKTLRNTLARKKLNVIQRRMKTSLFRRVIKMKSGIIVGMIWSVLLVSMRRRDVSAFERKRRGRIRLIFLRILLILE
jgi:hypothetical protein